MTWAVPDVLVWMISTPYPNVGLVSYVPPTGTPDAMKSMVGPVFVVEPVRWLVVFVQTVTRLSFIPCPP